jgi:arsenite-transporting ATPase
LHTFVGYEFSRFVTQVTGAIIVPLAMRIIIFSGTGGSGASTIAAGTACLLAASGKATLAFGLERGLGAALETQLDVKPRNVTANVDAVEGHGGLSARDEFRDFLSMLLDFRNMDPELGDDLSAVPGVNVVGRLLELEGLISSGRYEAAVVDGGALSHFLDLPAALDAGARWLDKLFAPRQQTVFEPFLRAFAGDTVAAGEEVLDTGRDLLGRLASLRDMFTDPDVTSVRLVTTAGPTSVDRVSSALAVLGLFSYRADAVIVNCLLPEKVESAFFDAYKEQQTKALAALAELSPGPVVIGVDLQDAPPRGQKKLTGLARGIWGKTADNFLAPTDEHSVARMGNNWELRVFLPFANRDDLRLEETDDGVAVHLNGRRCVLTLPEDVSYATAKSWTYEGRFLTVTLGR